MFVENGEWIMHGVAETDPKCIHTVDELEKYIESVGFLPLFGNEIKGFSVEEKTVAKYWWTGDTERDPWEWRIIIARRGNIAYGKFFGGRAGFITKKWLPLFSNFRRDGYDFDSLWEDGKASRRQKKIMDCFDEDTEIFSNELKAKAGFGKEGEKGFDSVVNGLQMQMYLVVRDFQQKKNKKGEPYGWAIAVYCTPEHLFGYKTMSDAYKESPAESCKKITEHVREKYKDATEKQIKAVLGS